MFHRASHPESIKLGWRDIRKLSVQAVLQQVIRREREKQANVEIHPRMTRVEKMQIWLEGHPQRGASLLYQVYLKNFF